MHPSRRHVHLLRRAANPMPLPFEELPTLSLKARADTTTGSDDSGPTCKDGDTSSRCEKPAGASNSTLPIILGSLLVFFLCVFLAG